MRWLGKAGLRALGFVTALVAAAGVHAAPIYVINNTSSSHGMVISAVNHLTALGHSVTQGGTLSSYAGYDQVWDLRYPTNLNAADVTAMGSYLQSGGRMYLTGEHSGFDSSRNNSLISWVTGVGGGTLSLVGSGSGAEVFTVAGAAVGLNSNPNNIGSVSFSASRTVASVSQGFLATETSAGSGQGSLVAWDFADITGASSARMLIGFDIEIFQNGQNWTQNMYTYLAAPAAPVPAPVSLLLLATGLVLIGFRVRKQA